MTESINTLQPEGVAQLRRGHDRIAAIENKASEAASRAKRLIEHLYPEEPPPPPADYEYDTDTEQQALDEWEKELEALAAEHQAEEYANLTQSLAEQRERAEHFRRLASKERELSEDKIHYPQTKYLVDGWLPTKEVHLLIGESGAGKTSWLFTEFLDKWQREEPILGHASHWQPYAVLVNDRSEEGIIRTLERLKLHPTAFPIKSINDNPRPLEEKISEYCEQHPKIRVLFIEGLHCGIKDINDYSAVSQLMAKLVALCRTKNVTIFGSSHVSKASAANGAHGRTAVIGSVATAGMSETIFTLTKKNGRVTLTINDHNGPEVTQDYVVTADGLLQETNTPAGFKQSPMAEFLSELDSDTFRTDDVRTFLQAKDPKAKAAAIKKAAQRAITEALGAGWIVPCTDDRTKKEKRGYYRKVIEQPDGWESLALEGTPRPLGK